MQPQPHQYYPSQYNPGLHYEQQQTRFDLQHPLEHPYQAQPFALQAPSPYTTSQHQGLTNTHPPRGTTHQARHPVLRQRTTRDLEPMSTMNQFGLNTRRPDELYPRRSEVLRLGDVPMPAGGMHIPSEAQVFTYLYVCLVANNCLMLIRGIWRCFGSRVSLAYNAWSPAVLTGDHQPTIPCRNAFVRSF